MYKSAPLLKNLIRLIQKFRGRNWYGYFKCFIFTLFSQAISLFKYGLETNFNTSYETSKTYLSVHIRITH